jgi:acetyl-CoA C-acetyltransferase
MAAEEVMPGTVIVAGARTPIGKLSGALGGFAATELGGFAIAGALERAGIKPEQVEYVLIGQVIEAGAGQITARQAAAHAGIPMTVAATTINKVCLSGLNTIYLADLMINAGEADIVVAGGMESMTQAPYLLPGARAGYRIGDGTIVDSMMYDGLFCAFDECAMGLATERYNGADGVSRERQDSFAALSHERAAAAIKDGKFADEIIPVSVPQRKGDPLVVDTDEGVRPETTAESLGKLRPAFAENGTVTAGNASQISDGAAAVVVMSKAKASELGLSPLGELISYGQVAGPDPSLLLQPSNAITVALAKAGLTTKDIDTFEINEAFAAVGCASAGGLGLSSDVVNVNGGAIALGHPVGMSGTRLALTSLLELGRRGGGTAAVSLCGGGGQGDAAILRTL